MLDLICGSRHRRSGPARRCDDRRHSSISRMKPNEVNWPEIFGKQGAVWFHTGGIMAALSDDAAAATKAALQAARAAGTVTSYDLNYRSKLWSSRKGHQPSLGDLLSMSQVLIGNEEDFQKVLGFGQKEPRRICRVLPVEAYKRMVRRAW